MVTLNQKGFLFIKILAILAIIVFLVLIFRAISGKETLQEKVTTFPLPVAFTSPLVKNITILVAKNGGRVDWAENGQIAFSKSTKGSSAEDNFAGAEIYTAGPDNSSQVCFTCNKSEVDHLSNDQPVWTPDGKYLVFQSASQKLYDQLPGWQGLKDTLTNGGAGLSNNLWAATPDGNKFFQLTNIKRPAEASLHAHFSRDGKKLFWSHREVTGIADGQWMMKIADFEDSQNEPKLANVKNYQPLGKDWFYESHSFSTDGQSVFFSASPPGPYDLDIYRLNLISGEVTNLTNAKGVWDEHSQLSPSGEKLVWISSQGYDYTLTINYGKTLKSDLWIMNPDGSGKKQLTFYNKPGSKEYIGDGARVIVADNAWSPDGKKLIAVVMIAKDSTIETQIIQLEFNQPQ